MWLGRCHWTSVTPGLALLGSYRDDDVVIDVYDTGDGRSVAAREQLTGAPS